MSLDAIARRGRMVAIHPTSVKDVVVLSPEKRDRVGVKTGYGSKVLLSQLPDSYLKFGKRRASLFLSRISSLPELVTTSDYRRTRLHSLAWNPVTLIAFQQPC
jgi:hypothetical protein